MQRLNAFERKTLASCIKADIDAYCVEAYAQQPRNHLGASVIGEPCLRRLVYAFRWMHREQFDGRMLRLFGRGHLAEPRFIEWLHGIGAQVSSLNVEGEQHRIGKHHGHFNGSLDSIMLLPPKYQLNFPFLAEFKTHNVKSFNALVKYGVKVSHAKHFAQMCVYGESYQYNYAIYFGINKNDDDIHVEVVELDFDYGRKLRIEKAGTVIATNRLPAKIAATSAYRDCKYCPMVGICHEGKPVDVNCRSCANSQAMPDSSWYCNYWQQTVPFEAIPKACGHWTVFI